jgi:hypothetical protein
MQIVSIFKRNLANMALLGYNPPHSSRDFNGAPREARQRFEGLLRLGSFAEARANDSPWYEFLRSRRSFILWRPIM